MRIALLGDFHLPKNQDAMTEAAMEDVAMCRPDLVVPLGDFGAPGRIGTPAGLEEAHAWLTRCGAPLRPILGNHDLERESGGGPQPAGTITQRFIELFELSAPYGVIEKDDVRLVFITTDYQPPEICYQVQECYTNDRQFSAIREILQQRPGVPVIVFSHAPPIGCGLRTVPDTHVRATNAYLSQNHQPERWSQLIEEHPEIVMWFSAHYHLGHSHPDSLTHEFGTWFFMTGVHSSATRDGTRHSRVIDIEDARVVVRTLCHEQRKIDDRYEWVHSGPIRSMIGSDKKPSSKEAQNRHREKDHSAREALERNGLRCTLRAPLVDATPLDDGMALLPSGNVVVATEEGYLWEVWPEMRSVIGTLHLGNPLDHVCVSEDVIWMADGQRLTYALSDDMWRFIRSKKNAQAVPSILFEETIIGLKPAKSGEVHVITGERVWLVGAEKDGMQRQLIVNDQQVNHDTAGILANPMLHLLGPLIKADGGRVHALCPAYPETEFYAVVSFADKERHPEVQKWRYES